VCGYDCRRHLKGPITKRVFLLGIEPHECSNEPGSNDGKA
jgi:hypothetical protein